MSNNSYTKNEVLLKATDVSLQYGEKQILRDINFAVHDIHRPNVSQGQVVSLIGRSGIGKTQLFRILAGLNKPTTGTVLIDADQHHRTIYQNLKIGLDNAAVKLSDAEKKAIINDYAETFGLGEHLKKYPAQLSGGQRQRVSIIQQVLTGNKFILLDEPFSGLDILMIDRVINLLLKVSTLSEHNTLVIVSHDIENAAAISDAVWILAPEDGKPGATIVKEYDLCHMGLAWTPDIRSNPDFIGLIKDIKSRL
jgi:ABC-type nitrate/sulfonate/bicarbonate transport system ATPase subunit